MRPWEFEVVLASEEPEFDPDPDVVEPLPEEPGPELPLDEPEPELPDEPEPELPDEPESDEPLPLLDPEPLEPDPPEEPLFDPE